MLGVHFSHLKQVYWRVYCLYGETFLYTSRFCCTTLLFVTDKYNSDLALGHHANIDKRDFFSLTKMIQYI